jgi:dGTPase
MELFPVREPYSGTRFQRAALKNFNSTLISRYVDAASLLESESPHAAYLTIGIEQQIEIAILKELTWHYVINNPSMATHEYGQRHIISSLFDVYVRETGNREQWSIFPGGYRESLQEIEDTVGEADRSQFRVRVVADLISSMTEHQAVAMYRRLKGGELGSVLDVTY